jgi:Mg-chelatase subunit ChlD
MKRFLLIPLFLFGLFACTTVNFEGESVLFDQVPPLDYDPVYLKATKGIDSTPVGPKLQISRIDPFRSGKAKFYIHLIDTNEFFLMNAAGLDWKDIWCEAYEITNGKETKIENFRLSESNPLKRKPISFAVVMDHSGSMGEERALNVQKAVSDFIFMKKEEDGIALIKYDEMVVVESQLEQDKSALISALKKNGLEGYGGWTATGDAIVRGVDELKNAPADHEKVVLVFTDGLDNKSKTSIDSVIAYSLNNNTLVCGFDYGFNIDPDYMSKIVKNTQGIYNHIYGTEEFEFVFQDIYNRFEHYYLFEYEPSGYGIHTIKLKLCLPETTLVAEAEFDNTPPVGATTLLNVYFDTGKSTIKNSSLYAVRQVAELMNAFPTMKIELRGHTDNSNRTGDPDFNKKLSQRRADAVKKALEKLGISDVNITAKGFGEALPVATNDTKEGMAKNRRTEFVVLEK